MDTYDSFSVQDGFESSFVLPHLQSFSSHRSPMFPSTDSQPGDFDDKVRFCAQNCRNNAADDLPGV